MKNKKLFSIIFVLLFTNILLFSNEIDTSLRQNEKINLGISVNPLNTIGYACISEDLYLSLGIEKLLMKKWSIQSDLNLYYSYFGDENFKKNIFSFGISPSVRYYIVNDENGVYTSLGIHFEYAKENTILSKNEEANISAIFLAPELELGYKFCINNFYIIEPFVGGMWIFKFEHFEYKKDNNPQKWEYPIPSLKYDLSPLFSPLYLGVRLGLWF